MNEEGLSRLRAAAACAKRQGCVELAAEIEGLLEAAAKLRRCCARCGEEAGGVEALAGCSVQLSFGSASRHELEIWSGALCDGCAEALGRWAPGLAQS